MSLASRVIPLLLALLSFTPSSIGSTEIIKTLQELNPGPPDSETTRFLLPRLAEKYAKYVTNLNPGSSEGYSGTEDGWDEYVYDPKLFLLTETEEERPSRSNDNFVTDYRDKREANIFREGLGSGGESNLIRSNSWSKGPSLSIVNPLDVLRQRLMLEIARRRQEKSQSQIDKNRKILTNLGKRGFGSFQSRGERSDRELRDWQSSLFEPSPSFSRWSQNHAEFPRSESHSLEHRNYNRHVN